MSNIVIIGSGPAGVSAALYTARAGVDTTVLTRGPGALDRAELIQNYYGFAAPISGAELERQGIEGAKAVGVKFVTTEAVGLTYTNKLTVETLDGDYPADAVVLATGASRATPRIPGLAGLEGHGVSYCATCDAFFYRGKDVAVVGSGEYALHEVQALLPVAASVTLLLNGALPAAEFPPEVAVRPEKIDAILGEQKVTGVQLSGGDVVELAGVFVALGVAGSTALARKIGAAVENDRIVTDEKMQTTPSPASTPPETAPAGFCRWRRPSMRALWQAPKLPKRCGRGDLRCRRSCLSLNAASTASVSPVPSPSGTS